MLIQGDNGTGKTSIVQALDWALRGVSPPLDGTASGEGRYRSHVLETPDNARVEITLSSDDTITADSAGTAVSDGATAYRAACIAADPILRRSQLLQFLGQRPVDRFRYLESFLDLGEADRIRSALADESARLRSVADTHKRDRETALGAIQSALPPERRPLAPTWESLERALMEWARELRLEEQEPASWNDIERVGQLAKEKTDGTSPARQRADLRVALDTTDALLNRLDSLPDLDAAETAIEKERPANYDTDLLRLLELALRHLENQAGNTCPVCSQSIDRVAVTSSIADTLGSLSTLRSLLDKRDRAGRDWRTLYNDIRRHANTLQKNGYATVTWTDRDWVQLDNLTEDASFREALTADFQSVSRDLTQALQSATSQIQRVLSSLPPEGNEAEIALFSRAVQEAVNQRAQTELVARLELDLEQKAGLLSSIADAIRLARQDVAQRLLDEISDNVTKYYRAIHPEDSEDEVTGAPKIAIQRRSGGTAALRGTFNGIPIEDPRWVYSDGHLDTVGICMFLALRRFRANRPGDARLMVLDDVVLSIDLGHARRLLAVLRDEFKDHQILLFTHNGLFAKWVSDLLPSFQRKVITGWTLEQGVSLADLPSSMERLAAEAQSGSSPKLVAQAIMTTMDEFLTDARFALQLSVPARRGEQYTFTDLWGPFCKRLRDVQKAMGRDIPDVKQLVGELADLPKVRNLLAAHENEFAREFPLATIRELAKKTATLISLLHCEACCSFAAPIPDRKKPALVSCQCQKLMYLGKTALAAPGSAADSSDPTVATPK